MSSRPSRPGTVSSQWSTSRSRHGSPLRVQLQAEPLRAATESRPRRRVVIVGLLGDQRLRREDEAGDRGGIAHGAIGHADRVDQRRPSSGRRVRPCARRGPVLVSAFATRATWLGAVEAAVRRDLRQADRRAPAAPARRPLRELPDNSAITLSSAGAARSSAVPPPPGTTPSSIAARVALIASSISCRRRFCSTGVAPPARITAVPPDSLARRSWNLSRSIFSGAASHWRCTCSRRAWIVVASPCSAGDRGCGWTRMRTCRAPAEIRLTRR